MNEFRSFEIFICFLCKTSSNQNVKQAFVVLINLLETLRIDFKLKFTKQLHVAHALFASSLYISKSTLPENCGQQNLQLQNKKPKILYLCLFLIKQKYIAYFPHLKSSLARFKAKDYFCNNYLLIIAVV